MVLRLIRSITCGRESVAEDGDIVATYRDIAQAEERLVFWRQRLQIVSNSCRSGALREQAAREVQGLERALEDLRQRASCQ